MAIISSLCVTISLMMAFMGFVTLGKTYLLDVFEAVLHALDSVVVAVFDVFGHDNLAKCPLPLLGN